MKEKYEELLAKNREMLIINQINRVIGWDTEVMMPKKAIEQRSNQQAYLARLGHSKITDPEIGRLLTEIKKDPNFKEASAIEKRNIELIQRDYDRETKVPPEFVAEYTKVRVIATDVWKEAREKNDFSLFQPHLEKILEMTKKYAKYLNPDLPPYEVLLDLFEPGMTIEKYNKLFKPLKEATIELVQKCKGSKKQPNPSLITREVPLNIQKELSKDIIPLINYDLERGRVDTAAHPFTTGMYDDVRITTRYNQKDFTSSFFAVMHEGGHGCYELNLPKKWRYHPVGDSCSTGTHESQSRFYENIIGRSKSFWSFYLPRLKEITKGIFEDVDYEEFIRAINRVEPSLIRVEADEVTYNMHIILRFELERDLFEGKIQIKDLPQLWKDKMKEMLGVEVPDNSDGVLQDIHWSGGAFGYFPTYTLGNIYAAQFFAKLVEEIPDWNERLEKGEVSTLTDWVKVNVQEKGKLYDSEKLVEIVTEEAPNPKFLIDFLKSKYSELYQF